MAETADAIARRFLSPSFSFSVRSSEDSVFSYAKEVLNLGFIYHGFHDAVRESVGDRIMIY